MEISWNFITSKTFNNIFYNALEKRNDGKKIIVTITINLKKIQIKKKKNIIKKNNLKIKLNSN